MDLLERYFQALQVRPETASVANPYAGAAGAARLDNLRRYCRVATAQGATLLLVGEAPGYRGCAVTGIPLTSRRLLASDLGRWELFSSAGLESGAGLGQALGEATATIIWRAVVECLAAPPLVANAFPFHPHQPAQPASNRPLLAAELAEGAGLLRLLLAALPGARPIAVGRQAARALRAIGVTPAATLRHPSHGGGATFARSLQALVSPLCD